MGVGPRGLKGHHVYCLNRALNPMANEEGPAINAFTELGILILGNACPWVTLVLYGALLTPLNKKAIGDDARPVSAEDRDCATWHKAAPTSTKLYRAQACYTTATSSRSLGRSRGEGMGHQATLRRSRAQR